MKKTNIFLIILSIVLSIILIVTLVLYLNTLSKINTDNTISNNTELEQNDDNTIVSSTSESEKEVQKSDDSAKTNIDYILLYDGLEIEKETGYQYPDYMEITENNKTKYNINYYNYADNKFIGVSKGDFGKEIVYDGYSYVSDVEKIATSEKINLIPREITFIEKIPNELKSADKNIENILIKVDLDGDNKYEYLFISTKKYDLDLSNGLIQPGVMEYSSSVTLYNDNFEKIDTLITINDDYADSVEHVISTDKINLLDIDNDNIIEILIEFPVWEGPAGVSIYKYNNGKLEGNIGVTTSITP